LAVKQTSDFRFLWDFTTAILLFRKIHGHFVNVYKRFLPHLVCFDCQAGFVDKCGLARARMATTAHLGQRAALAVLLLSLACIATSVTGSINLQYLLSTRDKTLSFAVGLLQETSKVILNQPVAEKEQSGTYRTCKWIDLQEKDVDCALETTCYAINCRRPQDCRKVRAV
jgi:hypothetical protein